MRATARLRVVGVSLGVFLRVGKTAAGGTSCMLPMGDVMAARICHLRFMLATSQHSARASAGIAEVARSFVHISRAEAKGLAVEALRTWRRDSPK